MNAEPGGVSLQTAHRVVATAALALFLIPILLSRPGLLASSLLAPLVVLSSWRLTTSLWSVDPLFTGYRSIEYLLFLALPVLTGRNLHEPSEMKALFRLVHGWILTLVASAYVGLLLAPAQALHPVSGGAFLSVQLAGVFPAINPNTLATYGGVLVLASFAEWLTGKTSWRLRGSGLLGLITMFFAQGRSAMAALAAAVVILAYLRGQLKLLSAFALVLTVLSIWLGADSLISSYLSRGQNEEMFWSFSGRTTMWGFAWTEYIQRNPFFGYGAFAGPKFLVLDSYGLKGASSLHNTWIEVLVESGIIGGALLIGLLSASWIGLRRGRAHNEQGGRELAEHATALLVLLGVRSFFSPAFLFHNDHLFGLTLACAAFFAFRRRALLQDGLQSTAERISQPQ
jgi:O-antigen ligase